MFEWSDFCGVADELAKNSNEAYIRSSIDRYYYSLFGSSREYLIKQREKYFLKRGGRDIHQRVKDELVKSENLNENELGETLDKLRKYRNQASYDKQKFRKDYFEKILNRVEFETKTGFQSLNYLKRNPPIKRWRK